MVGKRNKRPTEHAAADAVEEMLEYMYTSVIPCKVEPAKIFKLAMFYELTSLADVTVHEMVHTLSRDNVCTRLRTVRPHAKLENGKACAHWESLITALDEN